jgi:adenylate cyclase
MPLNDLTKRFLDFYEAGRHAYINRDFQKALTYFHEAHSLKPKDQAVITHLERATNYLENPPADFWDGVHTMTTK